MLVNNVEAFRTYCLQKKGVTEEFPFDETTLTFKVMGKLFALTSLSEVEFRINLKCNPDWAMELRDKYEDILPGYHMNKKHWNTVIVNYNLPNELLKKMIDHSYDLVVKGLTKKQQLALTKMDDKNE